MAVLRGWSDAIIVCRNCRAYPMLKYDLDPWSILHPWDDNADHVLVDPTQGTLEAGRYPGSVKFVPSPTFNGGFVTVASRSSEEATALTTLWIGLQLPITASNAQTFKFAENPGDLWGRSSHRAFTGASLGFENDLSNPFGYMVQDPLGSPAQIAGFGAHYPTTRFEAQLIPNVGSSFGRRARPGFLVRAYLDDPVVPDLEGQWWLVARHSPFNWRDEWLNLGSVRQYCRVLSRGTTSIVGYVWAPGEYRALFIDNWGTWHVTPGWRISEPGIGVPLT